MRLTLIHPCIGRTTEQKDYIKTWLMEPLAPAVIAALTPKEAEIKFYDDRIEKIPYGQKTDLVAMSVETYTAKRCYQIATEFRRRGVPVIMGGFHATLAPEEVINYAESIVIGEAEELWPQVVEDFKNGTLKKFYKQLERPSLEKSNPDRSIFKGKNYLPLGLVEAGRGCHLRCDFCAIQSYFKSTQKRRPIENIINEIKQLKEANRELIFFVDDNITSNLQQAKEFFRALIPLKIRWVSQASVNVAFDEEFLQLLKNSGCIALLIGFESLNKKNLSDMNKNFNNMRGGFEAAIKNLRKYGIRIYPTFIFGYTHDDLDTFKDSVKFSKKHKFFITSFNHLTPFPGTPLYKRLEQEGKLLYDKWWLNSNYGYGDVPIKDNKLTSSQIKEYCIDSRKSFYSYLSILNRSFDKWNCDDKFSRRLFFMLNFLFRKEVSQREGLPMGDLSFKGELLPANHKDKTTYEEFLNNMRDKYFNPKELKIAVQVN